MVLGIYVAGDVGSVVVNGFRVFFFFFKQKTAYEMCGRDWSSDVCSSDLAPRVHVQNHVQVIRGPGLGTRQLRDVPAPDLIRDRKSVV